MSQVGLERYRSARSGKFDRPAVVRRLVGFALVLLVGVNVEGFVHDFAGGAVGGVVVRIVLGKGDGVPSWLTSV